MPSDLEDIRWVLLNILWHSLPSENSDRWLREQMVKAGTTQAELKKITGEE